MSCLKVCFLLIFCSAVYGNQEQLRKIKMSVKVDNEFNKNYIKTVTFNNSVKSHIFLYCKENSIIDEAYAYFNSMSCEIAAWTINKLYEFSRKSPLFYQYQYQIHLSNKTVYGERFEKSVKDLIRDLNKLKHPIMILHDLLYINADAFYYIDTTILKPLGSLMYGAYFILKTYKNKKLKYDVTEMDIIRLVLKEMNDLQYVLSINCLDRPATYKSLYFYGYWINTLNNENVNLHKRLDKFTFDIFFIDENLSTDCSDNHIYLENFVVETPKNHIIFDIVNAYYFDFLHTIRKTVRNLLFEVKKSYSVEVLFYYHETVSNIIMKLVFTKIMSVMSESMDSLPIYIIENISQIYDKLTKVHYTNFPANMVSGFEILKKYCALQFDKLVENVFTNYIASLGSITFTDVIDKNMDTIEELDNLKYLKSILILILKNLDDFKCVDIYFKGLRYEHGRYYKPFVEHTNVFFPISYIVKNNEVCDFLLSIYSICFQAFRFFNRDEDYTSDKFHSYINDANLSRGWRAIMLIKNYLLIIIKRKVNDLSILTIAYNTVTLLENLHEQVVKVSIVVLQRILTVIMTEVNRYALKCCAWPKFNYLLYNNVNFIHFGDGDLIKRSILNFFKKKVKKFEVEDFDFDKIDLNNYAYFNVQFFYDMFIRNSEVLRHYRNRIMIYWNGKPQIIQDIYQEATEMVFLNYCYVYALYDVYFKSLIAIVYYEMSVIMNKNNFKSLKDGFLKLFNTVKNFRYQYFPRELMYFILDIINLLNFPLSPINKTENVLNEISNRRKDINKQLKKYGIVITITDNSPNYTILRYLNKEIENVKTVNKNYSNLKRRKFVIPKSVYPQIIEPTPKITN